MPDPHVISALEDKAHELRAAIVTYEEHLDRTRHELAVVTATLTIFQRDGHRLTDQRPAHVRNLFKRGEPLAICKTAMARRINHDVAYSLDGACTNEAEEYFSRLRRAEAGHHHHIAGAYLLRFAQWAAWREDNRRMSNGEQMRRLAYLATTKETSVDFVGYWQRHKAA